MTDDRETFVPHTRGTPRFLATEADIRADERRRVCAEEGHNELETTPLDAIHRHFRCRRCGERRTQPRETA